MTQHIREPRVGPIPRGASLVAACGPVKHRQLSRCILARILLHLKEQHDHGIVHFDLKPQNICVDGSTEMYKIKILDFGAAHPVSCTDAGYAASKGTRGYKDPISGATPPMPASDVYSVGSIMYDVITGAFLCDLLPNQCFGSETFRARSAAHSPCKRSRVYPCARFVAAPRFCPSLFYFLCSDIRCARATSRERCCSRSRIRG